MLERYGVAVGGADPVELEHEVTGRDLERRGQKAVGGYGLGREEDRPRLVSAGDHVLGERGERPRLGDPRLGDEGPPPLEPVDETLGGQPLDLAANGHPREPVALGKLALRRQRGARRQAGHELLQYPA